MRRDSGLGKQLYWRGKCSALYQGTTLVGTTMAKKDLGFSPWGPVFAVGIDRVANRRVALGLALETWDPHNSVD